MTRTLQQKTADRHGMSEVLSKYVDGLISEGKQKVIDERNQTVTGLTDQWNKSLSDLIGKRNAEIESIRQNMPNNSTSFTTGAGLTGGGYGLGRLAALSKHIGRARGHRAGLVGAGLAAGGTMLKDTFLPGKAKLPKVVPDQWVDPSKAQTPTPDPTLFQTLLDYVGLSQPKETRKWVVDKKYPAPIAGGTPKSASVPTDNTQRDRPSGLRSLAAESIPEKRN